MYKFGVPTCAKCNPFFRCALKIENSRTVSQLDFACFPTSGLCAGMHVTDVCSSCSRRKRRWPCTTIASHSSWLKNEMSRDERASYMLLTYTTKRTNSKGSLEYCLGHLHIECHLHSLWIATINACTPAHLPLTSSNNLKKNVLESSVLSEWNKHKVIYRSP